MDRYSAIKSNEILPFATTWMDLESKVLSEITQIKINTIYSHTWNPKFRMNE